MKIVLILCLVASVARADPNTCKTINKCGRCIANPDCSWCLDESSETQHCFARSYLSSGRCSKIMDPQGAVDVVSDEKINPDQGENLVLIQPQKVKVKLRPGDPRPQTVYFEAMQSKAYPLDIYFLLDLSWSMKNIRDNFADQVGKIISDITKVTEDLNVGFGSFIDKHLPPFASYYDEFNCELNSPNCQQPYSFYHQTSLSKISGDDFRKDILSANLGGNVDGPEGGFDALMQTMVCWNRIGWREQSRKIILFATDEDFHYAMDGKLIGILEPNDGQCHLGGSLGNPGYYTESKVLDYPSISHINAIAQNQSFVIIFAVIPRYLDIYRRMSENMTGSYVEALNQDSESIIEIIKKKYQDLLTSLEIGSSNVPERLNVEIFSDCSGKGQMEKGGSCSGLEVGQTVKFKAEIKAQICLNSSSSFTISLAGLNQTLVVDVETLCSCDCETPGSPGFEENSNKCSGNGNLECGQCSCSSDYSGANCGCNINEKQRGEVDTCGSGSSQICSGHGDCVCGKCVCFNGYYRDKCECKIDSCPRNTENQMCSGHGSCDCGNCQCNEGWTGEDCDCPEETSACKSPYNGQLCSGSGLCACNKCKCHTDKGGLFRGDFCETSPGEKIPCKVFQHCVECQAFQSGPLKDKCSECTFELRKVNETSWETNNASCQAQNEAGCTYFYSFESSEGTGIQVFLHVVNGESAECSRNTRTLMTAILTPVLLLFALLLGIVFGYIYYINRQYRKEYEDFLLQSKNPMNSASNQTPLYISPITTYKNPLYEKEH